MYSTKLKSPIADLDVKKRSLLFAELAEIAYKKKAEATKSIEDFYGEEKPAPEEPKKKVTKLYDWNKLDRSSPNYTDPKEEEGGGKIY